MLVERLRRMARLGWLTAQLSVVFFGFVPGALGEEAPEVEVGPFLPSHVWPDSGRARPKAPIASPYGPRLLASQQYRYTFHRGIAIDLTEGSDVFAVADGEVRIAGDNAAYEGPLVQIKHQKPETTSCDEGGCYYTNYMYLSEILVKEGDQVKQGQRIGRSGRSKAGFQYLGFQVRDGGVFAMHCIHPLLLLPYDNPRAPEIRITKVDRSQRDKLAISLAVRCPAEELDLNRVELEVLEGNQLVESRSFDMTAWCRHFSPREESNRHLEDQNFNNVHLSPEHFWTGNQEYHLNLTFVEVKPPRDFRRILIKARAIDAAGKSNEATSRGR